MGVYLYVALLVYKQVFRLQVSVDKIKRMKVFKGQNYLGGVESGMRLTATESKYKIRKIIMPIYGSLLYRKKCKCEKKLN